MFIPYLPTPRIFLRTNIVINTKVHKAQKSKSRLLSCSLTYLSVFAIFGGCVIQRKSCWDSQIALDGSGRHVSGLSYLDLLTGDVKVSENDMGAESWHAKVAIFARFHSMEARRLRATTPPYQRAPI